ncbi:hypothetical protein AJ85_12150 [Alkalihalobacillus alcalophilus ATCC 27647 = CGMCC 1.3604]|uniref:DUF1541 domain-containing protein n=1 Tax=Alkalihalobacillus alcalophilus ATCC 27647 = CGMCC 1.3604 TaxID=1218173 RepID=A0A094WE74_ALKAL|nr:YdhK family protein [Alkalihalobacillus alcalophilus]KGA96059.1 hypothetical protein BALCAV_0218595 [Alkalihalobacillus alcalophilus ATCC 27647 = CGMCC 1.3604]THG92293.1 hypothetical protein AJ85_12150 [Alkalihalobacillus alcalophilus ATCC 27647 = CGMCC 1.3604]
MKHMKKLMSAFVLVIVLTGCGSTTDEVDSNDGVNHNGQNHEGHDSHAGMNHSSSGEVPEGLNEMDEPTYEVGSEALIVDGHMEGMEGAVAQIVGAYDTYAYAISYTPENGGERVENHKWIIHEEIVDAGDEPFAVGEEVQTTAEHMSGMEGALVEIDSVERTTVYMVDFTLTTTGVEEKNHKWVTESELGAIEE